MRQLAILCLLTGLAVPGFAETYKWTDSNGQVHFSQVPPAGKAYKELAPAPPPAPSPNQDSLNKSLQKSVEDAPDAAAKAAEDKKNQAERDTRCKQAREQLAFLETQNAQRLLKTDAQGNVTRASEDDLKQRRAEYERSARDNCK